MSRSPRVVLAVSGGIACYKACEVVRRLRDHGAVVRVAMSRAATQFVGPTTFAALSGESVVSDLFDHPAPHEVPHVRWAEWGDLLCVAPCTADFLARMAHGIADDFPSTLHLAFRGPTLVAPAMEDDMYRHPAVQRNLRRLVERGVTTVGPNSGPLASGRVGPGRMAEPGEIVATARRLLAGGSPQRWLDGRKVVITAGPTRERIDPIRFLSNRSSGKMGFALAREAEAGRRRGHSGSWTGARVARSRVARDPCGAEWRPCDRRGVCGRDAPPPLYAKRPTRLLS